MGRSITFRSEPMKPSSGRASSAAKLAASAVVTAAATAALCMGASILLVNPAFAQANVATADDTPATDAATRRSYAAVNKVTVPP